MRYLTAAALALITIFTAAVHAHAIREDAKGWRDAKWGMTTAELKKAFLGRVKTTEPRTIENGRLYSDLYLPDASIEGSEYEVTFWMDPKTNELTEVFIKPASPGGNKKYINLYETLLTSILQKYGNPESFESDEGSSPRLRAEWQLSSSVIELNYLRNADESELLALKYKEKK